MVRRFVFAARWGLPVLAVACAASPAERDCRERPGTPSFAVVLSDYQSTSIGLLDADAETLTECWIDSGTRPPGLVAALSGDVVFPSDQAPGVLAVLDRFGTDVYTRVALDAPTVLGQVRLQAPPASGAFSANPHDAVSMGRSVWVSRFAGNVDDRSPPIGRGSDLLEIDPVTFTRTGRRVSLEPFIVPVSVATDAGPVSRDAFPRPSRMVRVGETLVVGLARLTLAFDGAAPGAVALVDVDAGQAVLHPLGEVANCGRVVAVPGSPNRVAVGCIGFSFPFGNPDEVRASAGLFILEIDGLSATTVYAWRPTAEDPAAVAELVALGGTRVGALAYGLSGQPDAYLVVDLAAGALTPLFRSESAFQIGVGAYDAVRGRLLVPDASVGIRRFVGSADRWTAEEPLAIDGGVGFPARSIAVLPPNE